MKPRILVVEDEVHLAQGLRYNLEAEGYKVSLVDNGSTALKLIESDPQAFDLLILDLMLPGMSGYAICERLRELNMALPVMILSARSLAEDRARGFDVGANQYLTKPFDLDELLARVRNLLRLHPRQSEPPKPKQLPAKLNQLHFGKANVNFETYEVTVEGKEIKLTHKELQLLRYFAENEGRVISRQELLAEVWDFSGDMQTRSVDQFLSRLRKTFEIDPAHPRHFITIRDVGYRFVSQPRDLEDSSPSDSNDNH